KMPEPNWLKTGLSIRHGCRLLPRTWNMTPAGQPNNKHIIPCADGLSGRRAPLRRKSFAISPSLIAQLGYGTVIPGGMDHRLGACSRTWPRPSTRKRWRSRSQASGDRRDIFHCGRPPQLAVRPIKGWQRCTRRWPDEKELMHLLFALPERTRSELWI